jgi:hypothetical protein
LIHCDGWSVSGEAKTQLRERQIQFDFGFALPLDLQRDKNGEEQEDDGGNQPSARRSGVGRKLGQTVQAIESFLIDRSRRECGGG